MDRLLERASSNYGLQEEMKDDGTNLRTDEEKRPFFSRQTFSQMFPTVVTEERLFWDANYKFRPTGHIVLGDILMVVFPYIPAEARELFNVSQVCRSWRERMNYVPQWRMLPEIPHPFETLEPAVSRTQYIEDKKDAATAAVSAVRIERAKRVTTHVCWRLGFWLWFVLIVGACLLTAHAFSVRPSGQFSAAHQTFWATTAILIVGAFLAMLFWSHAATNTALGIRRRVKRSHRVEEGIWAICLAAASTIFIASALMSSATWRAQQCRNVASTPPLIINTSSPLCNQTGTGVYPDYVEMRYLFEIPPRTLTSDWNVTYRHPYLTPGTAVLTTTNCTTTTRFGFPWPSSIKVHVLGVLAPDWYSHLVAKNERESLVFRTALPFEFYPPRYDVTYSTQHDNGNGWYFSNTFYIANVTEDIDPVSGIPIPLQNEIRKFEQMQKDIVIVAGLVMTFAGSGYFLICGKGFAIVFLWLVITLIVVNPLTMMIFGALCTYDPTNRACFLSYTGSKTLMYAGIVLGGVLGGVGAKKK